MSISSWKKRWFAMATGITILLLGGLSLTSVNAVSAPTPVENLAAYSGGDSIALTWKASAGASYYQVYRDAKLLSTVKKSTTGLLPYRAGTRFIDTSAQKGMLYKYTVRAVNNQGVSSSDSQMIASMLRTDSRLPTIFISNGGFLDMNSWLADARREALIWYPKFEEKIAYPNYRSPSVFTIRFASMPEGVAYTDGTAITLSVEYFRNNRDDIGAVMHEIGHVVQNYQGARESWATEGIGDWLRSIVYKDPLSPLTAPQPYQYYTDSYRPAAYYLAGIERNSANFIKSLNRALKDNTYNASFIYNRTGVTPEQWWTRLTSTKARVVTLKSAIAPAYCIDGKTTITPANEAKVQLWVCNNLPAQKLTVLSPSGTDINYVRMNDTYCMDLAFGSTTENSKVHQWGCNGTNAQQWRYSSGRLINPIQSMCLASTTARNGSQLVVQSCSGSLNQTWRGF